MVIVVENVSKDFYNKRKKEQVIFCEMEKPDVAEDVIQQIKIDDVIKKIESLPHIYKEVLLLKYNHELSDKEIAKVLEINQTTARKRIERARKKINLLCKGGCE